MPTMKNCVCGLFMLCLNVDIPYQVTQSDVVDQFGFVKRFRVFLGATYILMVTPSQKSLLKGTLVLTGVCGLGEWMTGQIYPGNSLLSTRSKAT